MSITPEPAETIDYDEVARAYRENLVTRLRGFRVGPEFLDAWVDDEAPEKALLSMFDAARAYGLPSLRVAVAPDTAARFDRGDLARNLAALGRVVASGDGLFEVAFGAVEAAPVTPSPVEVVTSHANDHVDDARREAPELALSWELREHYADAVAALASRDAHRGAPTDAPALVGVIATAEGVTLRAAVDPSEHRLTAARYEGAATDTQRGLLEGLCAALEGRSLREGSDHAVIRLEHALRDRRALRPAAGIVLPENASPAFRVLLSLTRALLADYLRQGHNPGHANFDSPSPAPAWGALDAAAQRDAVQRALDDLAAPNALPADAVVCLAVQQGERVTLACSDAVPRAERPSLLMRYEAALQARVEPTLHVYLEERRDLNKLRRL